MGVWATFPLWMLLSAPTGLRSCRSNARGPGSAKWLFRVKGVLVAGASIAHRDLTASGHTAGAAAAMSGHEAAGLRSCIALMDERATRGTIATNATPGSDVDLSVLSAERASRTDVRAVAARRTGGRRRV